MSIFGKRNNVITYTVNKATNRDIYITIQNGEVIVNAPWYFTQNKIQAVVEEKKNWILSKINEYQQQSSNMQSVKIFGKNYDLKVVYSNIDTPELNIEENYEIKIILPNKYRKIGNKQILKMSINKMYEQIVKKEIDNIMEKIRLMLGIAPEDYFIEQLDGEIAKCTSKKEIIISPEIIQFKRETIEYVIAHEFCHLKYKTHCKSFNDIMEEKFENYIKIESELSGYKF